MCPKALRPLRHASSSDLATVIRDKKDYSCFVSSVMIFSLSVDVVGFQLNDIQLFVTPDIYYFY